MLIMQTVLVMGIEGKLVMQAKQANCMTLSDDQLRDVDRDLLNYLAEGRVTPVYARERMEDEQNREVTSAYLQQRLTRFAEHNHARNLYGTGLYELVEDPRSVGDPDGE